MKHLKVIVLVATFALAGVYCDDGAAGKAAGAGGADLTPEDVIEQVSDIEIAEAQDVLVAAGDEIEKALEEYEGTEEAEDAGDEDVGEAVSEDQGEAVAKEEGDVEEEAKEEPAEEVAEEEAKEETAEEVAEEEAKEEPAEEVAEEKAEEVAEEDAEEGDVDIKGMKVELDPSVGRWYKIETKELEGLSKADRKQNKDKIKNYRNDLKKLRDQLKGMKEDKSKGKAKGKDKDSGDEAKIQAQIDELLAKIQEAKDKIGYGSKQKGIYTYWQNENLRLMVRNVETAGWYRLAIVAKNYGNLPKWYEQFNVSVTNESEGVDVGGVSIKASDNVYHRGTELVYLEEGDTDFNLVWKNDAYKENEYDANIQIKRVTLRYAKKNNVANKRLVRNAHEYSTIDGRFFWDKKSAWTSWADQTIGFSFPDLEAGKYEIIIMAKNYGNLPLPDGYDNFIVAVDADGTSGEATISAAQKGWRKGSVVLDLTGGTDVYLTWLNDQYKEGVYDTNIQYKKIFLKRVGDSERSALAAYLLGTRSGNRVLMSGILVVLVGFIALISVWNRKRVRSQA